MTRPAKSELKTKDAPLPVEQVKNDQANGNGAAKAAAAVPVEVKLEENDVLRLQLLAEKQRRIQAEAAKLETERLQTQQENNVFVQALNTKYGVDLNNYTVFPDQGIAKIRE